MSFGDERSAAWELDYSTGKLIGAARLAALIGRPVTASDIVEGGFHAAPADRGMVRQAFAPNMPGVRRLALEHYIDLGGKAGRLRHQGFVRAAPDGAPTRLTCITTIAQPGAAASDLRGAAEEIASALSAQAQALKLLSNELSSSNAPIDESGHDLPHALGLLVDQAAAIESGVSELAHARHAAESANLAKSQFLANMSHELRTPLNAVIGYAEMLKEDAEDNGEASAVQDLGRILAAAKHLLSLINEILDLSKIEAGRVDVAPSQFDPSEMIEDLVETVRPLADDNGNVIRVITGPAGEVRTDSLKVRQCVLNLLSNACKFTNNGEIELALERKPFNGVDQLFISVRDTGIGMTSEHMSRLFQPFVQADPSITQRYGGTGLGLTITRRLALLLGGDVTVKSVPAAGSTFVLHIPADFADAANALGAAAAVDALQGAEDAPLVIVIEDEPDARELAARALTRAGFSVQGVGGGEAGLALARAKTPALVLLDIFLPDRSGWRVLQSLKQDPRTQDIPVVVLSVNEDRAHAMALGAAEHMVKPADRDVLAAAVMRFARKRPQAAPAGHPRPQTQKQAS
jgi:signal transduction histidine kinase/ActR/RegA family two-component response regulator